MKQDSPDNNESAVLFRDTCISELPTQATFEVSTRTVIQVPDLNSEELDDAEGNPDEPPMKRVYTENTGNGSSGISKLVEFCSKDIKYVSMSRAGPLGRTDYKCYPVQVKFSLGFLL